MPVSYTHLRPTDCGLLQPAWRGVCCYRQQDPRSGTQGTGRGFQAGKDQRVGQADAGRTRPERQDYPGTENAARRIADLEREVKQREQSREHSSVANATLIICLFLPCFYNISNNTYPPFCKNLF